MLHLCHRYAVMQLANGQVEAWKLTLNAEKTGEAFMVTAPTFGSCWVDMCSKDGTSDEDVEKAGYRVPFELWMDAAFEDPFLRLVNTFPTSRDTLIETCLALIGLIDDKLDVFPQVLRPHAINARKIARGLLALASPVPRHGGSSLQDVDFIAGRPGKAADLSSVLPKLGKVLSAKIRRDTVWVDLVSDYRKHENIGQTQGEEMLNLLATGKQLLSKAALATEADFELWDSFLATVTANLATWRSELRSGATNELDEVVLKLLHRDVACTEGAVQKGEDKAMAVGVLTDLQAVLKAFAPDTVRELAQIISNRIMTWTGEVSLDKLGGACDEYMRMGIAADLGAVATKLQTIQLSEVSAPVMDKLVSTARHVRETLETESYNQTMTEDWPFCEAAEVMKLSKAPEEQRWVPFLYWAGKVQDGMRAGTSQIVPHSQGLLELRKEADTLRRQHLVQAAGALLGMFAEKFKQSAEQALQDSMASFTKPLVGLEAIAGGAKQGQAWHQATTPGADIIATWDSTLNQVKKEAIDELVRKVKQCVAQRDTLKTAFATHFPRNHDFDDAPAMKQLLSRIQASTARAATTKTEHLLCLALQRGGSKAKCRIEPFTARLSADLEDDWTKHMVPELVVKAKEAMQ